MRLSHLFAATVLAAALALPARAAQRNIVIFVADGLRYSSVTPETAPTMARVRREGVDFANSHAVYPTLTTANASAIATGHYLGDTGNLANTLYLGFPIQCRLGDAVKLAFLEDDCVLRTVKGHFPDDYLAQTTLLQAAGTAGYNTVLVGKRGPLAIQWIGALDAKNDFVDSPLGIFIDDATNHPKELDGTSTMSTVLRPDLANDAFGATGLGSPPFPSTPNLSQQAYLTSVTTQAVIPSLRNSGKPFVMLFWSRDPDTTQHGAHDSDGSLIPGVNSTSGRAAIYNADSNLKNILEALKQWDLADNTDVFVIADHGFSTIAKGVPEPDGTLRRTTLATGFVAIDIAGWLGDQNIYDPGNNNLQIDRSQGQRPGSGDALIGPSPDAPMAIVAANGGTDFIYVPDGPEKLSTTKRIFDKLIERPYVSALFVNDDVLKAAPQDFAGALPMSEINLMGSSKMPHPTIVIGFRSFVAGGCTLGEQMCTAEIADTPLQTGQGMHGSFSRADTRNFMAAIGPDFKAKYVDKAPVGNVDVAPTIAHILGIELSGPGTLKGRPIKEALKGGKEPMVSRRTVAAPKAANGFQTVLEVQEVGTTRYFDAGGNPGRTVGIPGR